MDLMRMRNLWTYLSIGVFPGAALLMAFMLLGTALGLIGSDSWLEVLRGCGIVLASVLAFCLGFETGQRWPGPVRPSLLE